MTNPLPFLVSGIVTGSVYGLAAMGLTLSYRLSRVLNFAHGAIAMFCAYSYWQMHVRWDWPAAPALVVAVLVLPTALALLTEVAVFKLLRNASVFATTAATVGMLLVFYGLGLYFWQSKGVSVPSLFPRTIVRLPGVNVSATQIGIVVTVAGLGAALAGFVRYSRWGVEMRAAVDNAGLAEVRGVSTVAMARLAWVFSYVFAALSGVLLAPIFGSDPLQLTLLVLYALVAQVIGGMGSLPLTLAGGLIVGLTDALALGYLPAGDITARVRGVLPFALLFAALVLRSRTFVSAGGVNESRASLLSDGIALGRAREPGWRGAALVGAAGVAATLVVSDYWTYLLATGVAYGLIFLSFKVFTSTTGLVSLAQGAFAGIAAFTAGILVHEQGLPWGVGVAAGAAAAAGAGVVVALPTVRLRGIFLALATVAFAQLVESTVFNIEAFSGLQVGKQLPRPWGFESDVRYFLLLLGVFLLVGWFADAFRRSVVGRELQADLASGMGSRSVGIRPERGRMIAFLVAAGIAGIGGSMFTALTTRTTSDAWVMITALIWLTVTAVGGIGSMWGALLAGLLLSLNSELIRNFPEIGRINIALFGAAGLLFLRRPGGIVGLARDLAGAWRTVRLDGRGRVPVVLDRARLVGTAAGPRLPALAGQVVNANGHNGHNGHRPPPAARLLAGAPAADPGGGLPRLRASAVRGARLPSIRPAVHTVRPKQQGDNRGG